MVEIEKWYIDELIKVCLSQCDDRVIEIPRFQRKRSDEWTTKREKQLIKSIKQKFPIGSLTLYRITYQKPVKYIIIDGLQRIITILKYYDNPYEFKNIDKKIQEIIKNICEENEQIEELNKICSKWFTKKYLGNYYELKEYNYVNKQNELISMFNNIEQEITNTIVEKIINDTKNLKEFINISDYQLAIMICTCNEEHLFKIFERLNTASAHLKEYEICAARWNQYDYINIDNKTITEEINKYYLSLKKSSQEISIFNDMHIIENKHNLCEYLFGLKGYLDNKYEIFKNFDMNLIFKIIGCCLNKKGSYSAIPESLLIIFKNDKIKELESKLFESIDFTLKIVENLFIKKNSKTTQIHILSCIISTYYNNYNQINRNQEYYIDLISIHYLNDKLIKRWTRVLSNTIPNILNDFIYLEKINTETFKRYFKMHINLSLKKSPKQIDLIDKIILSLIKNKIFGINNNDTIKIEHIISKPMLIKYQSINQLNIPMNCLGNLCYLDSYFDKQKKTRFIDSKYNSLNNDIIDKYIFVQDSKFEIINNNLKNRIFSESDFSTHLNHRSIIILNKLINLYHNCFE